MPVGSTTLGIHVEVYFGFGMYEHVVDKGVFLDPSYSVSQATKRGHLQQNPTLNLLKSSLILSSHTRKPVFALPGCLQMSLMLFRAFKGKIKIKLSRNVIERNLTLNLFITVLAGLSGLSAHTHHAVSLPKCFPQF